MALVPREGVEHDGAFRRLTPLSEAAGGRVDTRRRGGGRGGDRVDLFALALDDEPLHCVAQLANIVASPVAPLQR